MIERKSASKALSNKLKVEQDEPQDWTPEISNSCSTSAIRPINIVTNPVISREWGTNRIVIKTNGKYRSSFVTQIICNI